MRKLCIPGYPKCAKWRFRSVCANRKCADWSEYSLGAHVRRYVLWRCGSYFFCSCRYTFERLLQHIKAPKESHTAALKSSIVSARALYLLDESSLSLFIDIFTVLQCSTMKDLEFLVEWLCVCVCVRVCACVCVFKTFKFFGINLPFLFFCTLNDSRRFYGK